MGVLFVVIIRLLAPLVIFRWPLFGGLLCFTLDTLDVVILDIIDTGGFSNYHSTDKYLDMAYLSAEFYVSLQWKNALARNTNVFLFIYRSLGFILFELSQLRVLLFIFQNVFENFYLFYLGFKKTFKKDPVKNLRGLAIVLIVCTIPKIPQEYMLHYVQVQPWGWIKSNILLPLKIPI